MSETSAYLKTLLYNHDIAVKPNRAALLDAFCKAEGNHGIIEQILQHQKSLMKNWELSNRIQDINEQAVMLPNATVGKPYQFTLDLQKLNWADISIIDIAGLEGTGVEFNLAENTITGTPEHSGDFRLTLTYSLQREGAEKSYSRTLSFIINPNPRSLWKNLDSDRSNPYWKEDDVAYADLLGDKRLVVASKRGRSHANVGSFRDDDFACKYFEEQGWGLVAVADGAGSAKYSREGSRLACTHTVEYFNEHIGGDAFASFDALVAAYANNADNDEVVKSINLWIYNKLGAAAFNIHKHLEQSAVKMEVALADLHTTLVFTLFKKYSFGCAVLSFGIGDCPLTIVSPGFDNVINMNWLDVGEYGGGTRFITMPEIFKSDKFGTRFNFKLVNDFAYIVLMSDGIYDPKFEVEANLKKPEHWKAFFEDLKGQNPEDAAVEFTDNNPDIAAQLSNWVDFWSPGNHDDRTLAIIY